MINLCGVYHHDLHGAIAECWDHLDHHLSPKWMDALGAVHELGNCDNPCPLGNRIPMRAKFSLPQAVLQLSKSMLRMEPNNVTRLSRIDWLWSAKRA